MGNYFPTPEKVIQDRRESLKDKKKQQGNTQKRKYQDFLDIVLSSQVNISNFWAFACIWWIVCVGG